MARRARKGVDPTHIALGAIVLLGVVAALWFALGRSQGSMRSVSELDIAEYVNKGDSMGGTEWRLTGTIAEKIRWTPDRGQLVSVSVDTAAGNESVAVLIPAEFNDMSINIGDRFTMRVEVGEKTVLVANEIERS